MNWNCLIWSILALFSGIIGVSVMAGITEPLDTTELTFILTMVLMINGIVYAKYAAKEGGNNGEDQNQS